MSKVKYVAWSMAVMMCTAGSVQALVLAGWDVDGVDVKDGVGLVTNAPPYSFHATTSEVDHVEAVLALGEGVTPSTTTSQYGFKIPGDDETTALAEAIESNHYIEIALTAESGYALHLDSIEMLGQGSSGACSNMVLMTSLDGFAAGQEIASAYPANQLGGFDTDPSGFGGPIDLSHSRYQNLTGTVRFRLYGWNSTSGTSPTYIRNLTGEDLVVYGEVVTLSGSEAPVLSLSHSNGMASIVVEINGAPSADYVLQSVGSLTNSNGWATVSLPFSSSTNWTFGTTNSSAFYRAVSE